MECISLHHLHITTSPHTSPTHPHFSHVHTPMPFTALHHHTLHTSPTHLTSPAYTPLRHSPSHPSGVASSGFLCEADSSHKHHHLVAAHPLPPSPPLWSSPLEHFCVCQCYTSSCTGRVSQRLPSENKKHVVHNACTWGQWVLRIG